VWDLVSLRLNLFKGHAHVHMGQRNYMRGNRILRMSVYRERREANVTYMLLYCLNVSWSTCIVSTI
jgi:hypothetical protein